MINVAEVVEEFPHSSVAIKSTSISFASPQVAVSELILFDQEIVAPQISVATAPAFTFSQSLSSVVFPLPSHSTVALLAAVVISGAVVSSIVKVAEVVEEFPHSSVAVKVTSAFPVSPQSSDKAVKSFVQTIVPSQTSEAVAPPFAFNQLLRSVIFPAPSHSTVKSAAAISIFGGLESVIVKLADVDAKFPQLSVAVKVTVTLPVSPHKSDSDPKSLVQFTIEQLSEAPAPPKVSNQLLSSVVFPAPSHSTEALLAEVVITGGVVSSTVIICVNTALSLAQSSVAIQVLVTVYPPSQTPTISGCSLIVIVPQSSEAIGSNAIALSKSVGSEHSTVRSKSPARVVQIGAVVSSN